MPVAAEAAAVDTAAIVALLDVEAGSSESFATPASSTEPGDDPAPGWTDPDAGWAPAVSVVGSKVESLASVPAGASFEEEDFPLPSVKSIKESAKC